MSGPNDFNQMVIERFRASAGKPDQAPGPMLLLTTTGAKSGKQRTTPVVYSTDGDHLVIVASKGGAPNHPDWYFNLVANPVVTVELGTEKFQARATIVADEAERERLYAQHADLMPGFKDYVTKTTRKIPVVLLDRIN